MKTFGIYKLNNHNDFCCWIDARSEYEALRKYRAGMFITGYKTLVKGLRHWSIITSYGAEFVAVESGKNR